MILNSDVAQRQFIRENTTLKAVPGVPEVEIFQAEEAYDLWHKTEDGLGALGLEPPFWAFPWAGGQGLSRHILDNPQLVAGKSVLDFASGSGLVAIAARKAGAANVTACDIDPICSSAIALNAQANHCKINYNGENWLGDDIQGIDVVLAGDIFYDQKMTSQILPWINRQSKRGVKTLIGDPERKYTPTDRLTLLGHHHVPVSTALEGCNSKRVNIFALPEFH